MPSILVALNDSISSRAVLDYLINLSLCPEEYEITLFHLFRKPTAGRELMGHRFMEEQPTRFKKLMDEAKAKLVKKGFKPENIEISLVTEPHDTVTDGIIAECSKKRYTMVIIGRKRMSKAEEFVMGDISVKLIRALADVAVLVVKSP